MRPYVSIDIETTGLNPETCQILEIVAVIDNGADIKDCPTFHCYVVHNQVIGDQFALAMQTNILKRIATREHGYLYLLPDEVANSFYNFLRENGVLNYKYFMPSEKFTIAGTYFDFLFLRKLPDWEYRIRINNDVINPSNLYWEPTIDGFVLPDVLTCIKRAGIVVTKSLEALDDARIVIQLVREFTNNCKQNQTTYDFGNGEVPAHKHPNGGGWVADTATVMETAFVGPNARVYDHARVFEGAKIYGHARIYHNAEVFSNAIVYGNTEICGHTRIYNNI